MRKGMIYKLLFLLALIGFAVILIMPTIGEKNMKIILKPDILESDIDAIKSRFAPPAYSLEKKEGELIVTGRNLSSAIQNEARILNGVQNAVIEKHWAEKAVLAKQINLGLDLQGGMHLAMRANFEKIEAKNEKPLDEREKNEITQQALELIRNRIDKFGVSEPSIRPRGAEVIEIQLPGVKDPEGVKKAIGTTGSVEYRLVEDKLTSKASEIFAKIKKDAGEKKFEDADYEIALAKISAELNLPSEYELFYYYIRDKDTGKIFPSYPIVLEKKVSVAGSDISKAWVGQDEYGGLAVHFSTTAEGAAKFSEVTAVKNHGRRLAIVIDNKVRSAPSLNVQISSGKALINGDFTQDEVYTLARIIKEGALPVDLKIVEERTVGPSLGQDSIESGAKAFVVGLICVVIFMSLYYKIGGIIASFGLIINMLLMFAILSWLGFTLTMPGIGGFILTIGMAVDANVLIYERMREEIANGKSPRMAIVNGYDRAFSAIFDGNLTTMIAAFILSQFGTGPIKGFAVVLMIGLLTSMFTALYLTRFIYELISLNKNLKKLSI